MDKCGLVAYLEGIDRALQSPATLCIFGSAACILLGEPNRTSLDVDVAGPHSKVDYANLRQAAAIAGIPVDPEEDYPGDHIEWVAALRLCLPAPDPRTEVILWQGAKLTVITVPVAQLIASKLIRYDAIDQSDIRYLLTQYPVSVLEIEDAVAMLPAPFRCDPLVRDNLANLRADVDMWRGPAT